ncbi:hypothetical protein NST38_31200 [Paenibacillus sp. FSL H8-0104]|uniref:hypothetical protein n=1 Tax=Paenibacillus sp. FSL H8-0104 TaxID=2954509 RepID=UPI0030FD242C
MSQENILSVSIPPLIPSELMDEYRDFINPVLRDVLQATCLRRYLDGAIDLLLKDRLISLSNISENEWKKKDLDKKIVLVKNHIDKEVATKYFKIKKTGNKGAHPGNTFTANEIRTAVNYAVNIFEDLLVVYFKKNKIGTELPLLTLLSSLPPIKRVYILEKVRQHDKNNLWIIDKLSMAYLKSGNYEKSLNFLESVKDDIGAAYYEDFILKIEDLKKSLHHFDISKNIDDVARIFNILIDDEYFIKYPEFTNMFCVLVSGYNY